jgi:hypothetical protein
MLLRRVKSVNRISTHRAWGLYLVGSFIRARYASFEGDPNTGIVRRSSSDLSCIRDRSWRTNATASASEPEAVTCSHNSLMRSSKVMKCLEQREDESMYYGRCPTLDALQEKPEIQKTKCLATPKEKRGKSLTSLARLDATHPYCERRCAQAAVPHRETGSSL